jgi:hypothetical protein
MFNDWKAEKAIEALVTEAQDLADKLATTKPHFRDSYATQVQVWAAIHHAKGEDLYALMDWKPAAITSFAKSAAREFAALRKAREYERSDGLNVWLQTARALTQPRIMAPAKAIWEALAEAGLNVPTMVEEVLEEQGLTASPFGPVPKGFEP